MFLIRCRGIAASPAGSSRQAGRSCYFLGQHDNQFRHKVLWEAAPACRADGFSPCVPRRLCSALFVPFVKILICYLTNLVSNSQISISTGSDMLNHLIPSIAILAAAYIIHYGIHLQDEMDHTL